MADVTFSETLDWLDEHKGQRVVVEVGCEDPRTANADFADRAASWGRRRY